MVQEATDVLERMHQSIDEIKQQFDREMAPLKANLKAMREELDMLKQDVDDFPKPPHLRRILLTEAMYTLGLLVEQYVHNDKSIDYVRALTLNQLQCLYDTRQLSTGQARRWEHVVDFVGCCVSLEKLLIVDSHLRKACAGPALGYEREQETAGLKDLQRWARRLYNEEEYPRLHAPLQKMLEVLSQFSSIDRPCLPDRSFASMLHPNLLRIA
ncbi:g1553 [Coccomyxa elongata]